MASPVWKGALSFGLVSVPVRLYGAAERHTMRFHQFERGTSDRIRYRKVNERTGKEVGRDDIVKGVQADDEDEYVVLEPEDLESIAPGRSRSLEISAFVPAGSVEPLYYDTTYYLAPDTKASTKPYKLLCAALDKAGRLGIALLVMRERQHVAVIGPQKGVLTLSTLWWADEVRDPDDVLPSIDDVTLAERELELAGQLIESMADEWQPENFTDDYQDRVEELVRAKHKGERVKHKDERPAGSSNVVELSQALRQSLQGRGGDSGDGAKGAKGKRSGTAASGGAPRAKGRGGGSAGPGKASASGTAKGRGRGGSRAKPKAAATEAPVARLTKKDLTKAAADLGVPGRSSMSRAELEKAVTTARRRHRASSAS